MRPSQKAMLDALFELAKACYIAQPHDCREYAELLRNNSLELLDSQPDVGVFTGRAWSAMMSARFAEVLDRVADDLERTCDGV
jgi:hypothetical protein